MALLEVRNLSVNYGLIKAVKGISFSVDRGEIVSLIGANGAGKTTTMHALAGLLPKADGRVTLDGRDITATPAHTLVSCGMAQVPEGRRIFGEQTVLENLKLGYYSVRGNRRAMEEKLEEMYARFPVLKERGKQIAGTLSGGEQQMLAMCRALMSSPKLLLLDEPSMGLSPLYVENVFEMIHEVNRQGTTILLVEQNAKKALSISHRAYVLEIGEIVREGSGDALLHDEAVMRAYLGG